MKKIFSIVILISLLLALISPVILADAQEDTLIFARSEEFVRIDTQNNHHFSNKIIDLLVYDRLIEYTEPEINILPGLVKRWEISENELEVTFFLHFPFVI